MKITRANSHFIFKTNAAILLLAALLNQSCVHTQGSESTAADPTVTNVLNQHEQIIKPEIVTEPVAFDTDDPAIWVNADNPSQSLIIGTDKDENGGLYVFNLEGKIIKMIQGLKRPDNVDIEYGLTLHGKSHDIAVTTERLTHKLRIYSLPDLTPLDNGGIAMFEGETGEMFRDLMGIALYKNPETNEIHAVVGRKNGPTDGSYLWQYKLEDDGKGSIKATLLRKFGKYSGHKEIESIAVDDRLGYVYYSDEGVGIRKYFADPEKGNEELALFGTTGFTQDHEGISVYEVDERTGYIIVSDQGANQFFIFNREGSDSNPHDHKLIKVVKVAALESDGSETSSVSFNDKFKNGLFVVMSTDKTFHYYKWEDIAGKDLRIATPNSKP